MNSKVLERIHNFLRSLIQEGRAVLNTQHPKPAGGGGRWIGDAPIVVDFQAVTKWASQCRQLLPLLGPDGDLWRATLTKEYTDDHDDAVKLFATLEGIEGVLTENVFRVQDLVRAETFEDLLEQADYLFQERYFLAAGVLGRAVLEEHLRMWCARENCALQKPRPTLGDYNQALYAGQHVDKTTMKHVDSMAAVGNDAAHNLASLRASDVERLLRDVRDFLISHSP